MSTPQNTTTFKLTRGKPTNLGTITAAGTQCVQFTIPEPTRDNQGFLIIQASGNVGGGAATLEGSLDAGATWFVMSTASTNVLAITGQLTGDAAAGLADAYIVSGMGAGTLFRYGITGGAGPNTAVWALVG